MSLDNSLPDTLFWRLYQGRSKGLLHWPDVDAFWEHLATKPEGWYVYDLESDPPESPARATAFLDSLNTAQALVNQRRESSHSGAIYVDSAEAPAFIKIFDPTNMGTSCGGDHEMILPRYIFSKAKPDRKPEPAPPKKGFLGRLVLAR